MTEEKILSVHRNILPLTATHKKQEEASLKSHFCLKLGTRPHTHTSRPQYSFLSGQGDSVMSKPSSYRSGSILPVTLNILINWKEKQRSHIQRHLCIKQRLTL